ncbi:Eaa1 [Klebsiella pneumoniae]|nr:Eaa1 [Klebsiella pneumoniae]
MTNNHLTDNQLTKIIESAEAVISALAGTNDDVHPDNSSKMCLLWDSLNDDDAPPEAVLAMARELQERRKAAMDSEPVATLDVQSRRPDGNKFALVFSSAAHKLPDDVYFLYRHAQPAPEREQVRREHAEWSQATFGNVGPVGPLKHLSKEALEAAAEPGDLSEWADMQFLLWDAQRRAGVTDEQITQAMIDKLAVNKQRKWPEPKDGEPRLHIKEQSCKKVDRCDVCTEGARGGCGTCIFNGNFE